MRGYSSDEASEIRPEWPARTSVCKVPTKPATGVVGETDTGAADRRGPSRRWRRGEREGPARSGGEGEVGFCKGCGVPTSPNPLPPEGGEGEIRKVIDGLPCRIAITAIGRRYFEHR
jgi:hypothetical protein